MRHRAAAAFTTLLVACPAILLSSPAWAKARAKPYDFNGDGYPELVIGAPGLKVRSHPDAGGVIVLPASRGGVSKKERVITQSSRGVAGASESWDQFGAALASADFNRDGYADLAVGQPNEKLGRDLAGAVTILYGSRKGLRGKGSVRLIEPGVLPDAGGTFGTSVATADFDGDGWADLAVDDPGDNRVSVFRGGRSGYSTKRSLVFRGGSPGSGVFGSVSSTLAVGDLDQDGRSDLVFGYRGRSYGDGDGIDGSLSACYGGSSWPAGCVLLTRRVVEFNTLAIGNVFGDSRPEIVAGMPRNDEDGPGVVLTLSLSGTGSATKATESFLNQDSPGVPGSAWGGDYFGADVVLGDLDHDGFADLVVGVPGEAVGAGERAGRVTVLYGGSAGYQTTGALTYDQDTTGIPGRAEGGDRFGFCVALLDHDQDGHLDLAVRAPGENGQAGAITTLSGDGTAFTTRGARTFVPRTPGIGGCGAFG